MQCKGRSNTGWPCGSLSCARSSDGAKAPGSGQWQRPVEAAACTPTTDRSLQTEASVQLAQRRSQRAATAAHPRIKRDRLVWAVAVERAEAAGDLQTQITQVTGNGVMGAARHRARTGVHRACTDVLGWPQHCAPPTACALTAPQPTSSFSFTSSMMHLVWNTCRQATKTSSSQRCDGSAQRRSQRAAAGGQLP